MEVTDDGYYIDSMVEPSYSLDYLMAEHAYLFEIPAERFTSQFISVTAFLIDANVSLGDFDLNDLRVTDKLLVKDN